MTNNQTATSLDPLNLEPLPPENRQRLLRFPLGIEESALLPLEEIAEILRVNTAEILPVPEMPSCVLGICNWRGKMLWLVDLNHLIGGKPLLLPETVVASAVAMVVQVHEKFLGLVVQQVNDIELHELQRLQPAVPGLFPSRLLPFVLGALPGGNGMVLDVKAITQCPLWHIHGGGKY
ncbi:MAG: chemotaxis protein CheW [Symploca sp. SIO2G7]|nr:chemotaxis protein CheW [Symploca sp. SIO2G7]